MNNTSVAVVNNLLRSEYCLMVIDQLVGSRLTHFFLRQRQVLETNLQKALIDNPDRAPLKLV